MLAFTECATLVCSRQWGLKQREERLDQPWGKTSQCRAFEDKKMAQQDTAAAPLMQNIQKIFKAQWQKDLSRCSVFAWVTRRRHVSSTIYDFWIKAGRGGCPSRHGEPLMIAQLQNCTVIKSYWTKKNLGKYSLNYFGPWAFRWETTHWYYSFSNIHFIEYQERVECWLTMVNRGEKSLLWFPFLYYHLGFVF